MAPCSALTMAAHSAQQMAVHLENLLEHCLGPQMAAQKDQLMADMMVMLTAVHWERPKDNR
jgi:hypothetical protein